MRKKSGGEGRVAEGKNAQDRGADGKHCKSLTVRWAGATPFKAPCC